MRSLFTRRWLLAFVALAQPFAFAPSVVRAEDDEPSSNPLTGDPESQAKVTSFFMVLEKDGLPKDWTMLEGDAAGPDAKALEDAVNAIAKDKGVSTSDDFSVLMRSVACPDGAKVHYAIFDLGAPSQTFMDALKAEGAKKGWSVRTMGTAKHGLVTAAPDALREQAEGVATDFAGRMITRRAIKEPNPLRALGLSRIALQLDSKSAGANFVYGYAAMQIALEKRPAGDLDLAIKHLKAALAKDATNELGKRDAVFAKGKLGQSILNKGGPSVEARDYLKETVAQLADLAASDRNQSIGFQYDLACAHGRLKEIDEAFALLSAVLEADAKEPVAGISEIWREKDDDLASLRGDPRFKKLLEKYPEAGGSDEGK